MLSLRQLRWPRVFARRSVVAHAHPEFTAAAGTDWPDRILAERITDKLHEKQGRSIARWTLTKHDGSKLIVFLKRHYRLSKWVGLLARLMPNRAWSPGLQEWEHLRSAESLGLPVPRALAAAEWRGPGLMLQSCLAVEELAGMLPLHEAIPAAKKQLHPIAFALWKQILVRELVRLTVKMHSRNAFHKDLYLCHFYIAQTNCAVVPATFEHQIVAIDFHRFGRHTLLAPYFHAKDLAQLLYSTATVGGVSDRDRLRFWKLYREQLPVAWPIRLAARFKYRLYLRHARRKRARRKAG